MKQVYPNKDYKKDRQVSNNENKRDIVYCFGNPHFPDDDLAIYLADELKIEGFEFIKSYSPDFLMNHQGDLIILDVAKGIMKVEIVDDVSHLENQKMVSLHDFDLGFFLKLLKELGKLEKITIIAIPFGYDKEKAKEEVTRIISIL